MHRSPAFGRNANSVNRRKSYSELSDYRRQVEEQLKILWTTTDAAARKAADEWLTKFQSSYEAWAAGIALVASGSTEDTKLFGATVLSTKLRSGGADSLPGEAAEHMLEALLGQIKGREPGRLRATLRGVPGERVTVLFAGPSHKDATEVVCTIPSTGTATAEVPAATCA